MSKVKIFIACHKPCVTPNDDVYTPIHVGKAVSNIKMDIVGDDTGENISAKNPLYCETTAHYWVWKNISRYNVDYVGFCHYRRYFNYNFTELNVDELFSDGTDVILPDPHYRFLSMQHTLLLYISSDDFVILKSVMHKLYPEYDEYLNEYLLGVIDFPYNMLVCKKELYDEYARWLFSILEECEKYIKPSQYTRGKRIYGYIAEFLMPIFFIKNGYKIKSIATVFKSDNGDIIHKTSIKDKIFCRFMELFYKQKKRAYMYDQAHILALVNDGVPLDLDK